MFTKSDFASPIDFSSQNRTSAAIRYSYTVARAFLLLPLLAVVATVVQTRVDPAWLYLDTLEAIKRSGDCCHVYYGLISNLGVALWTATSAICIFAAIALMFGFAASRPMVLMLFTAGALSGLLGMDDLFQIHEKVLPFFGVHEQVTLLAYGLVLLLVIWFASRISSVFDWPLFGLALGMFFSSILIDQVFHNSLTLRIVIEDGAKFIGIASWSACLVSTTFRLLLKMNAAEPNGNFLAKDVS